MHTSKPTFNPIPAIDFFQSKLVGDVEDFVVPWSSPSGKELE